MEWKSLFIGLVIGALVAVPLGMAHSGGFNMTERIGPRWGSRGMGMMGMSGGMMITEIHEEMEAHMEEHAREMGISWEEMKEMHEYCERVMGIEDEGDE